MMTSLVLTATTLYVPADDVDVTKQQAQTPPGMGNIGTLISWGLWIAGAVLFALFIRGIVTAARARSQHGQVDAEAPLWPLIWGIILGAAGTIWNQIVG